MTLRCNNVTGNQYLKLNKKVLDFKLKKKNTNASIITKFIHHCFQ